MANDVRQRFVDGQDNGSAVWLRKSQFRRKLAQCVSYYAEQLGIAPQFHFE
jgi:hypothetical protein